MASIGWGKPRIFVQKIGGVAPYAWRELPTPVEDTTSYETEKGDKMEAKIEGGEYEDMKYKKNKGSLKMDIRVNKNRLKPFKDNDGVIEGEYRVAVQPEDATVPSGIMIYRSKISCELKMTAADGSTYTYTAEALAPESGNMVDVGLVSVSETGVVSITPLEGESDAAQSSGAVA